MGLKSWRSCPERCAQPGWLCLGHPGPCLGRTKTKPLAVLPQPLEIPGERTDPVWVRRSQRSQGGHRSSVPTWQQRGTAEGIACAATGARFEVWFAGSVPWARAESRPRGVCRQAGGGGGGCQAKRGAQPRLQPLSRASPPLMSLQGQQAPSQSRCHQLACAVTCLPSSFPSPSEPLL